MKPLFLLLAITSLLTCLAPAESHKQTVKVHFHNGDSLQGHISSWDKKHLTFNSSFLETPISITPSSIKKLSIIPDSLHPKDNSTHEALVAIKPRFFRQKKAKTADLLRGQLTGISAEKISIDTWYAGELNINRSMIAKVDIYGKGKQAYYGPNSIEEWTQFGSEPAWSFNGGILTGLSHGHIAKDIDMSNSSVISFDYAWVGPPELRVLLFSNDPTNENPQNCYDLVLRSQSAKLHKIKKKRQNVVVQMRRSPKLRNSSTTHVKFYADTVNGTFALFLDGKKVFIEQDRAPNPNSLGGGLHLITQNTPLTHISNLQVNRWNGDIPKINNVSSLEQLEGDGEKILLRNGDTVVGTVEEINDQLMSLSTPHTPVQLPLKLIRSIDLKNLTENAPIMKSNDVIARFHTGGWVILDLHSITSTSITGYNQAFGTATFSLDAFSSIEFNIYNSTSITPSGTSYHSKLLPR